VKRLAKRPLETPRTHRGKLARIASTQFRSRGGHYYSTSTLRCDRNLIYGDSDIYATNYTTGTGYRAHYVTVINTLYRWYGSVWVEDLRNPPASAIEMNAVTNWSQWVNQYGQNVDPGHGPTPMYTIGNRGYYYGIWQEIEWHDVHSGALVDSASAFLRSSTNDFYCWM
jgi:hypothetical protein